MTELKPTDERSTVRLPSDAARVGVDIEENTHLHSRIRNRVFIVDDDEEIVDVQDLESRGLAEYVRFVRARRGWERLNYNPEGIAGLLQVREAV